jgi:SSS family solute:Na+ symporter
MQYAWVSVVNAIVMILGSYLALFFVGDWLAANIGGWQPIADHYFKVGEVWKLEILRLDAGLIYQIIIPVAVLHISAACVTQGIYQPLLSAAPTKTAARASSSARSSTASPPSPG